MSQIFSNLIATSISVKITSNDHHCSFHDEQLPPVRRRSKSKEHAPLSNSTTMASTPMSSKTAPPLNLISMKSQPSNFIQPRMTKTATLRKLKLRNSVMNMPSPTMLTTASVPMVKRTTSSLDNFDLTKTKPRK